MEKLKACPFCGSTNVEISPYGGAKAVACMDCFCRSEIFEGENAKEKAIAAWNRRAKPENKPQQLCAEDENFVQTKYGFCFYTLDAQPLIYNLYVHPQYRRHGYSHVLLELVINEIRKRDQRKIYIQAEPRENSIGLADLAKYYKSMGLIVEARKPEGSK